MATKKCRYCAEEIQAEAIKCRYCQSWLEDGESGEGGEAGSPPPGDPLRAAAGATGAARRNDTPSASSGDDKRPKLLFEGIPSWKAFLRAYSSIVLAGLVLPFAGYWSAGKLGAGTLGVVLAVSVPLALAVVGFFSVTFYRRSLRYRITSANIETEYGILQKRIDNLELWRCRDIRYNQTLIERMLGISHITIYTADVTTAEVLLRGMPASRRLFEQIRDSVEIQRQARNVIGMVQ